MFAWSAHAHHNPPLPSHHRPYMWSLIVSVVRLGPIGWRWCCRVWRHHQPYSSDHPSIHSSSRSSLTSWPAHQRCSCKMMCGPPPNDVMGSFFSFTCVVFVRCSTCGPLHTYDACIHLSTNPVHYSISRLICSLIPCPMTDRGCVAMAAPPPPISAASQADAKKMWFGPTITSTNEWRYKLAINVFLPVILTISYGTRYATKRCNGYRAELMY